MSMNEMVNKNLELSIHDLMHNPSPRVPIVLCLDVSISMNGEPLQELNAGLLQFIKELKDDPVVCHSAEVAVVAFSGTVQVWADFCVVHQISEIPQLVCAPGGTDIGAGVKVALDLLEKRKTMYQRAGIDYYQPWLVLMSDGQPTTDEHISASQKTRELEGNKKLSIFAIGIGGAVDMPVLQLFSKRLPLRLKGLKFNEFFEWLSKSVQRVSVSRPGEAIKLDTDGIKSWGEL